MKSLFTFLFLLFSFQVHAAIDIEFILDLSGSMNKADNGEKMIDSLRKGLAATVQDIPEGTHVAVRVYGHRVEQSNKTESCKDTELLIPFGPINREQILQKVQPLQPKGYTPIAYSLEQSRQDFVLTREAEKTIILMTDGEETCGGDPIAVVQKMQADGFKVKIHTVGFNVDATTKTQLMNIAQAGGGQYFDASGSSGIQQALKQATQASLLINKKSEIVGTPIRGGNGFATAVQIQTGEVYRLDHHQKVNEWDYFYVDLKAGQELIVGIATGEKGLISGGNGVMTETDRPYAGIALVGPDHKEIGKQQIIGQQNGLKKITYNTPQDGKYYILVGTEYAMIDKDYVTFKVASISRGDLGTDQDAGSTMQNALKMAFGRFDKNYMSNTDVQDVFSFSGKKGDQIQIGYIPQDTDEPYLEITLTDSYKQKVFNYTTGKGSGYKSDVINLPSDDTYYLEMKLKYTTPNLFNYTLEVKKIEMTNSVTGP